MRRLLGGLACALALVAAPPAFTATARSADYSDLWWNAAESGWGAHVTLQDEVVFMVLFVYDDQRNPRFLVASSMPRVAGPEDAYAGTLYETSGPPIGEAFDPDAVSARAIGTATLRFHSPSHGMLVYTAGDATVTKAITRQTWQPLDYTGEYLGGLFASATDCFNGLPTISYPGSVTISQSGEVITIDSRFSPGFAAEGTCRMTGRLVQHGSEAAITGGAYACEFFEEPNSVSGTFEATGLRVGPSGFSMRYRGREGSSCVHAGHMGGMRRGHGERPPADDEPPPE